MWTARSTGCCTSPAPPRRCDYLELPIQTLKVGALGTHNALGLAKAKNAGFLLASTSEVYGDPLVHPQREDYWGNVNPVGPRGVYDEAKRFAEAMTMAYHRTHAGQHPHRPDLQHVTGPRMRTERRAGDPRLHGAGADGRPDHRLRRRLADALVPVRHRPGETGVWLLMERGGNDPVNIGNPQEMTLLELAKRIIRLAGSRSEIVFRPLPEDDPKVRQPDITRARTLLEWEPRVDIDEGLKLTLECFRAKIAG